MPAVIEPFGRDFPCMHVIMNSHVAMVIQQLQTKQKINQLSQIPPIHLCYQHMDTRSCSTVPKHGGSGRLVFCHWLCEADDTLDSGASLQDPFPEIMNKEKHKQENEAVHGKCIYVT